MFAAGRCCTCVRRNTLLVVITAAFNAVVYTLVLFTAIVGASIIILTVSVVLAVGRDSLLYTLVFDANVCRPIFFVGAGLVVETAALDAGVHA